VALGDALHTGGGELVGDTVTDLELRRSRVAWIGRSEKSAWIFERLSELVVRANRTWKLDLTGFEEDLQYSVYDEPGAFYTWHQDGLDDDVATRKLALVVQLTDPDEYEGADLEMFDVVADWAPEDLGTWREQVRGLGAVTAFPAFEYHRVTPLVSGRRASLVAWVGGPPFR
jgi:PKHD-type hydroxylase